MRILAIVPTLRDDPSETIRSLTEQTDEVSKIVVAVGSKALHEKLAAKKLEHAKCFYVRPDFSKPLGERVATAINKALAEEKLAEYDYVLKVDADVILPPDFIEKNLANLPDFIGSGGSAMLFKTSAFLKAFKGKYPEVFADDTYVASKFLYKGYNVKRWRRQPQFRKRETQHHSYRHELQRGIEWYKLGYEPLHVLDYPREFIYDQCERKPFIDRIFPVLGYFLAILRRMTRYEFAPWIFHMQVRRLLYGKQFEY